MFITVGLEYSFWRNFDSISGSFVIFLPLTSLSYRIFCFMFFFILSFSKLGKKYFRYLSSLPTAPIRYMSCFCLKTSFLIVLNPSFPEKTCASACGFNGEICFFSSGISFFIDVSFYGFVYFGI